MNIKKVTVAYMSPNGGTKKIAKCIIDTFKELGLPCGKLDFLPSRVRKLKYEYEEDDLLVFVTPVYYGRMPWCIYDFTGLKGNKTNALIVCVYGNRMCEDAPYETSLFLQEKGFLPFAYAEFVSEHTLYNKLGEGRPNLDDFNLINKEIKSLYTDFINNKLVIPYKFQDHPLKERGKAHVIPHFKDGGEILCDDCKLCMRVCPLDLIDKMTGLVPEDKASECMGCMACVTHCTTGARGISKEERESLNYKMQEVYKLHSQPKENMVYSQYK